MNREEVEQAMTVVLMDDVRQAKYLPSSSFTGFSSDHARMLAANVDGAPEYCAVPLAVHRWAASTPEAPTNPREAWAAWRIDYDAG